MQDWQAYLWIALGVLVSSLLPYAVTAIFPNPRRRATGVWDLPIWPGAKLLAASLVVGLVVLVVAKATGVPIDAWWEAVLIGLGADRFVQVLASLIRR